MLIPKGEIKNVQKEFAEYCLHMNHIYTQFVLRRGILLSLFAGVIVMLGASQTAAAASNYQQTITLTPGWSVVSTPRILDSHAFSAPETLTNFSIYALDASRTSGWATMAELGQTEFTPLYGYFINNKTGVNQTLTLNYKASTTPNERLFSRAFTGSGCTHLVSRIQAMRNRKGEVLLTRTILTTYSIRFSVRRVTMIL